MLLETTSGEAAQITVTFITNIAGIFIALGTLIGVIKSHNKVNVIDNKQDIQEKKLDTITNHTDGTISGLRVENQILQAEITSLREVIKILREADLQRQKDASDVIAMQKMQESATAQIKLVKALVSPAIDPNQL